LRDEKIDATDVAQVHDELVFEVTESEQNVAKR